VCSSDLKKRRGTLLAAALKFYNDGRKVTEK